MDSSTRMGLRDGRQRNPQLRAFGSSARHRLRQGPWHVGRAQATMDRYFSAEAETVEGSGGMGRRVRTLVVVAIGASLVLFSYASLLCTIH
jgi:hypothetical protein